MARRDVRLLARQPKAEKNPRAIMLPDLERYADWERVAGDRPVSSWLTDSADVASGWRRRRSAAG